MQSLFAGSELQTRVLSGSWLELGRAHPLPGKPCGSHYFSLLIPPHVLYHAFVTKDRMQRIIAFEQSTRGRLTGQPEDS